MRSTHSYLQVTVTVLLAIIPFISATPSESPTRTYPSPKGLQYRDYVPSEEGNMIVPRTSPPPPGWSIFGCYTDNPAQRALTSSGYSDPTSMTIEFCTTLCKNTGPTVYAGVENGTDCYCGNVLTPGSVSTSSSNCATPCVGNPQEICGGDTFLSLYGSGTPGPQPTLVLGVPSAITWECGGCWGDNNDHRTLTTEVSVEGGPYKLTVEKCVDQCVNYGFQAAGVELAQQCFCGNSTNGAIPIDRSKCMMACSGDSTQNCGGPNALVLYYQAS